MIKNDRSNRIDPYSSSNRILAECLTNWCGKDLKLIDAQGRVNDYFYDKIREKQIAFYRNKNYSLLEALYEIDEQINLDDFVLKVIRMELKGWSLDY